jgi:hypothetical protein
VPDPQSQTPVFVDPSGRRRRVLRIATAGAAVVIVGYLVLVLLTVFGAPLPPAAQLPLPAGLGTGVDAGSTPSTEGETPVTTEPLDGQPSGTQSPRTTTAPGPTVTPAGPATPTPVTTPGRHSSRPSEPPGQSKVPTTPPGHR